MHYRRDAMKVGKQELLANKWLFYEFLKSASNSVNLDDIDSAKDLRSSSNVHLPCIHW